MDNFDVRVASNYYYSEELDEIVQVLQDNKDGTVWCYAANYGYVTLDANKVR